MNCRSEIKLVPWPAVDAIRTSASYRGVAEVFHTLVEFATPEQQTWLSVHSVLTDNQGESQ